MMAKERIAAFFDLDGTLIHGDSQEMEFFYRLRHDMTMLRNFILVMKAMTTGVLSYFGLASRLAHNLAYISTYRGMSSDAAASGAEKIFRAGISKKFYRESVSLLEEHRKKGHMIILVTATTEHLIGPVDEFLKPDYVICTELETDVSDIFTGRPAGSVCIGEEKVRLVRELAENQKIDLRGSYAYSDHHADIPFLECAGNPVAVNPTRRLRRTAKKRGWPVYRFRNRESV